MSGAWSDYELLDFGAGRKLERFGAWVLDRPCPAARGVQAASQVAWRSATARYHGERAADGAWTPPVGRWELQEQSLAAPVRQDGAIRMRLEPLPSGQIGVFPEQQACWRWIAEQAGRALAGGAAPGRSRKLRVLNLFAYTGGSTLAAAGAGCEVSHVDASATAVAWARRNAALSGLGEAPIRWLVEDALTFVLRELKRGRCYDTVILDPPSYGHGPKGQVWKLSERLPELLGLCAQLTGGGLSALLLTCHTPGYTPRVLCDLVERAWDVCRTSPPQAEPLVLRTAEGRGLPAGVVVRWAR